MAGRLATGALAMRGAGSPDAFASFLAGRARTSQVVGLAMGDMGGQLQCPNCGYRSDDADFKVTQGSTADTNDPSMPEELRTPAPDTGYVRNGAPLTPSRGSVGAPGLSNPSAGINLAAPRYPVNDASDVLVTRSATGGAQIRHRRGGTLIGEIVNDNGWKAVYGGRQLTPRAHQRAALADLIGTWNHGTTTLEHPADGQLQPPPQQTPLMAQYGIPAIRALANGYSSSDGGSPDSDNDNDSGSGGGLTPKGQGIFKKLKAKGWPDAKAMMFAKRAQSFGGARS